MRLPGRGGVESSENPKSIAAMWAFSLFWCGFSGAMFYVWAFRAGDWFGSAISGLFLLIGLAILAGTIRASLDYAKFGAVRLLLDGGRPAPGGKLQGRIELPAAAAGAGAISAELACMRVRYSRGSKGGTSASRSDIWSGKQRFPVHRTTSGGAASICIGIPADAGPSDVPGEHGAGSARELDRDYHKWELRIGAEVEGLDLRRTFGVRVYPAPVAAAAGSGYTPAVERAVAVRGVNPVVVMDREAAAQSARGRGRRIATLAGIAVAVSVTAFVFSGQGLLDPILEPRDHGTKALEAEPSPSPPTGAPEVTGGVPAAPIEAEASSFEPVTSSAARDLYRRGATALSAGRIDEAEQALDTALTLVERTEGRASPMAAFVLHRLSAVYQRRGNLERQVHVLERALRIVEQQSHAALKRTPGMKGIALDVEMIAAELGYAYWELRRYDRAFQFYQRAHRSAGEIDATERSRNRRLAVSSAGLMASACMLGKWDVADSAMAELKERMVSVDEALRRWLDYWVRTGEPRLAARRC